MLSAVRELVLRVIFPRAPGRHPQQRLDWHRPVDGRRRRKIHPPPNLRFRGPDSLRHPQRLHSEFYFSIK